MTRYAGTLTLTLTLIALAALTALTASAETCPMDLSYVQTMAWNSASCHSSSNDDDEESQISACCQTLKSLLGVGLARHLRDTGMFELPTRGAADACVAAFAGHLARAAPGIRTARVRACFRNTSGYVSGPTLCAGIRTTADWAAKLGGNASAAVDSACAGDLSPLSACHSCKAAGDVAEVAAMALYTTAPGVDTALKCYYFICLYAAGVANARGPADPGTAACILKVPMLPAPSRRRHRKLVILFGALAGAAALLAAILVVKFRRLADVRRRAVSSASNTAQIKLLMKPNTGAVRYSFEQLRAATGDFPSDAVVGAGGFGTVYRGTLPDGREIAVKEIRFHADDAEADAEFLNEVEAISNTRHRNLVVLRGWCAEAGLGRRFLVYDYVPNGSLEEHLFVGIKGRGGPPLPWPARRNIVLGVARGLCYLHDGVVPAIFHRDIKPTNILLNEDMNPCIADFGLARIITGAELSWVTTRVAGTRGYLAPEYALYGQLNDKSDVYSFGVLVLEIMSGRRALAADNGHSFHITDWAWKLVKEGRCADVIDAQLPDANSADGERERKSMERFVKVGILCSHVMVAFRPRMSQALKMLLAETEIGQIPDRPLPFASSSSSSSTSSSLLLLQSSDLLQFQRVASSSVA